MQVNKVSDHTPLGFEYGPQNTWFHFLNFLLNMYGLVFNFLLCTLLCTRQTAGDGACSQGCRCWMTFIHWEMLNCLYKGILLYLGYIIYKTGLCSTLVYIILSKYIYEFSINSSTISYSYISKHNIQCPLNSGLVSTNSRMEASCKLLSAVRKKM